MFISSQNYHNYDHYFNHSDHQNFIHHRKIQLNTNHTQTLFQFDAPVKLSPLNGLSLLIIHNAQTESEVSFLLESDVILNSHITFNVLGLSKEAIVNLSTQQNISPTLIRLNKELFANKDQKLFSIKDILASTIYHFNDKEHLYFKKQYFYELIFVELGEYQINLKEQSFTLSKGDILLLEPQKSTYRYPMHANRTIVHSIKFEAHSLPSSIIQRVIDGSALLSPLLDVIHQENNPLKSHLLFIQLEMLLLTLCQQKESQMSFSSGSMIMRERYENELFNEIMTYIEQSDIVNLKVSDLVQHFNLSRSTLQQLFNKYEKTTPKIFINQIRLEKSRKMIRESNLSITEIADILGYGSIQYFSRAFSKAFNMSPSEYAKGYAKRL